MTGEEKMMYMYARRSNPHRPSLGTHTHTHTHRDSHVIKQQCTELPTVCMCVSLCVFLWELALTAELVNRNYPAFSKL